jgi:hypothetical protein
METLRWRNRKARTTRRRGTNRLGSCANRSNSGARRACTAELVCHCASKWSELCHFKSCWGGVVVLFSWLSYFSMDLARPVDRGFAIGSRGDMAMLLDNVEAVVLRGVVGKGIGSFGLCTCYRCELGWVGRRIGGGKIFDSELLGAQG